MMTTSLHYYLGIEIGGTKLQIGIGPDDGHLAALWRGAVDVAAGPDGIRQQIAAAVPELLATQGIQREQVRGAGIGFGGPVDDRTRTVVKSHQIQGWDDFPLADWIADVVGMPAVLGNDADVAGLAEALHGAGKGHSPIFYITIGSGIGGGLILDGEIYRGAGRGAAEIGHLSLEFTTLWNDEQCELLSGQRTLEETASGWGIQNNARAYMENFGEPWDEPNCARLFELCGSSDRITVQHIAQAAAEKDRAACMLLRFAVGAVGSAICNVIALLCPRRIIIGGGVSLIGEDLFFAPLRQVVAERVFPPFAGLTEIVPAALGEEVVVHGAIALARKQFG
jgi:glucokinase